MISAKKLLFKACEKIGAIKNEVTGLATTVASHMVQTETTETEETETETAETE